MAAQVALRRQQKLEEELGITSVQFDVTDDHNIPISPQVSSQSSEDVVLIKEASSGYSMFSRLKVAKISEVIVKTRLRRTLCPTTQRDK